MVARRLGPVVVQTLLLLLLVRVVSWDSWEEVLFVWVGPLVTLAASTWDSLAFHLLGSSLTGMVLARVTPRIASLCLRVVASYFGRRGAWWHLLLGVFYGVLGLCALRWQVVLPILEARLADFA